MNPRYLKGVLTPSQGYICVQCRLDHAVFQVGGTRRYQQTNSQPVKTASRLILVNQAPEQETLRSNLIKSPKKPRGQSSIKREDATGVRGDTAAGKPNTNSETPRPVSEAKSDLQTLQERFTQQRLKITHAVQKRHLLLAENWENKSHDYIPQTQLPDKKSKAHAKTNVPLPPEKKCKAHTNIHNPQPPKKKPKAHKKTSIPKLSDTKPKAPKEKSVPQSSDTKPTVHKKARIPQLPEKKPKANKKINVVEIEGRDRGRKQGGNERQQEDGKTLNTAGVKVNRARNVDETPKPQKKARKTKETENVKISETSKEVKPTKEQPATEIKSIIGADISEIVGVPKEARSAEAKAIRIRRVVRRPSFAEKLLIKKIAKRTLPKPVILETSVRKLLSPRINKITPKVLLRGVIPKVSISKVSVDPRPLTTRIPKRTPKPRSKPVMSKVSVRKLLSKVQPEHAIGTVKALELEISAIETDQPPVPNLSYGLDRVLFNPGVYQLQDPRSRVFNFDPYLQSIMPIKEFEFNALKEYITSSRDESLKELAKQYDKRYVGSSSSMTGVLAHFHFLLSQWRDINPGMLSKSFPEKLKTFTEIQRCPSAIFLRWRDGSYAIDADKEFDTANVLSMLGKSMEKLLTLDTKDFERYRKLSPDQVTPEESNGPEAYHYCTMGDFLMRSQLDAHDPRLPGTGMFDLKTRAVVSIRMNTEKYEQGVGYQIKSSQGQWESYEREYYDMIRAAFLKYSLQVRMGRMDGIFVAFHNVQRIFGFQYISLPEMDLALHGQLDTKIGDQEFKLSTDLLNKILNKATEKYPETSLRIHFETRDTSTAFMYIFVEPVTEDQVQQIQSTNEAKTLEFERNILGLNSGDPSPEEKAKWADIEASVQEAMAKDERSITELNEAEGALPEAAGETDSHSDEVNPNDSTIHGGKNIEYENEEDLAASSGADDDHVDDKAQEDEEGGEEAEEDGEEDAERERTDQEIDEDDNSEVEEDVEEDAVKEVDHDAKTNEVQQMEEGIVDEAEHGAADVAMGTDDTVHRQSLPRHSDNDDDSPSTTQDSQQTPSDQDIFSANLESSNPDRPERPEQSDLIELEAIKSPDERFDTQADAPFLDTIAQEGSTSKAGEIFAMTLTIRNKVNDKYTFRPDHLNPTDDWTVEYSLAEVADAARAWSLYRACQARRMKKLSKSMEDDVARNDGYIKELRELSRQGAIWRKEMDAMDEARPRYVVGQPLQAGGGDGKGEGSADQ